MSEVSASLFYGVFVRTSTLIEAAEACQFIRAPLAVIKILLHRRHQGTLQSKTNKAIARVPDEVWEMMRDALIADGLKVAGETLKDKLSCGSCRHVASCEKCIALAPLNKVNWASPSCELCQLIVGRFIYRDAVGDKNRRMYIDVLLSTFGLRLQGKGVMAFDKKKIIAIYGDSTAISPLAIKLNHKTDIDHQYKSIKFGRAHLSVQTIPSSTFEISNAAKKQLEKSVEILLKTFNLEAVDPNHKSNENYRKWAAKPKWIIATDSTYPISST